MALQAVRKLVKAPDGYLRVIFVDAQTGQEIGDLTGYTILDQGVNFNASAAQRVIDKANEAQAEDMAPHDPDEWLQRNGHPDTESGKTVDVGPENNYGYVSKPAFLGWMGVVPGFIGTAAKALSMGLNANNTVAVGRARADLGLGKRSVTENVKGFMRGPSPEVGKVSIGGQEYSVSMEPGPTEEGGLSLSPMDALDLSVQMDDPIGIAQDPEVVAELGLGVDKSSDPESNEDADVGIAPTAPTATPSSVPGRSISPGRGLANLGPEGRTGGVRSGLAGKGRGEMPGIAGAIADVVQATLGPEYSVSVESGTYSPAVQAAIDQAVAEGKDPGEVGQIGSSRHGHGKAADFDVIGPDGKVVTDPAVLSEVVVALAEAGFTGIGYGQGYMGGSRIHADISQPDKPMGWGAGGSRAAMDQGLYARVTEAFGRAAQAGVAGNPGSTSSSTGEMAGGTSGGGTGATETTGVQGVGEAAATPLGFMSPAEQDITAPPEADKSKVTTAQQAITDVTVDQENATSASRTAAETQAMAYTIAGELGSKTIQGILSGDPRAIAQARQEIAAIATTMDNRARSSRHAKTGMAGVLSAGSYNSLSPSNKATTDANFGKIGGFITKAVEDYSAGTNPSPVPEATHYSAMYVAPGWEAHAMTGLTQVGEHKFSTVAIPGTSKPEYSPGFAQTPATGPAPTSNPGPQSGKGNTGGVGMTEAPTARGTTSETGPSTAQAVTRSATEDAISTPTAATQATANPHAGIASTAVGTPTANPHSGITSASQSLAAENIGATRSALGPVASPETSLSFDIVSPEAYAAAVGKSASAAKSTTGNVMGYSQVGPQMGFATMGTTSQAMGPNAGGYGSLGAAPAAGQGVGSSVSGISGTGIGFGYSGAGSLSGTASGMGSGYGAPSAATAGSFSGNSGNVGAGSAAFSGAGPTSGFGSAGAFGNSTGGGYGHQGNAGIGMGMGPSGGTMGSTAGMNAAANSFGGFSAGSLGGSASGMGSGLGAAGTSGTSSFSGSASGGVGGGMYSGGFGNAGFGSAGGGTQGPNAFGGGLGGYSGSASGGAQSATGIGGASSAGKSGSSGSSSGKSGSVGGGIGGVAGVGSLGGSGSGGAQSAAGMGASGKSGSTGSSGSSSGKSGGTSGGGLGGVGGVAGVGSLGGSGGGGAQSAAGMGANGKSGSSSGNSGSSGSGGGGGDSKVLCGYFYSKGRIPLNIYRADLIYATKYQKKEIQTGYLLWAKPLVKWLDKKPNRPIIDNLLFPLTKGWVYEMAYRTGHYHKSTLWSKAVTYTGEGICYVIGKLHNSLGYPKTSD